MMNISLNVKLLLTDDPLFVLFNTANLAKPLLLFLNRIFNQSIVAAVTPCRLWAINRHTFQAIMVRTGMAKHQHYVNLLKSVPLFSSLADAELHRVADLLDEQSYKYGEYVVRQDCAQGEHGATFYIISKGQVHVTQRVAHPLAPPHLGAAELPASRANLLHTGEKTVSVLTTGGYFGERALTGHFTLSDGELAASVVVSSADGCTCVTLDRASFERFVADRSASSSSGGDASAAQRYGDDGAANADVANGIDQEISRLSAEMAHVQLSDMERVATLGVGGFGRVELVRPAPAAGAQRTDTYALKVMKKQHIVETNQQQHVINERNILIGVNSAFIVKLYKTYRDAKCLYMLMEPCLGGEVWSLLRDKGYFEDHEARFYAASAMEALEYLHKRGIIYRDLKPENVLLDNDGYAKLVDFGFAKKIGMGQRTWTFCGTPEYVAPEIVLNKGHDFAADYWSLGIFIYELLTGAPPFGSSDPMTTYNLILKGVDAIDLPRHVSKHGISLVKRLCKASPAERLGCARAGSGWKDVRKARWFEGFSFEALRTRTIGAPFVPPVKHESDVSNFDNFGPDADPSPDDDLTGWDQDF